MDSQKSFAQNYLDFAFSQAYLFQYFHIILTVISIKSKVKDNKILKNSPLGLFLITLISCSAGGFLTGILTQKKPPILAMFGILNDFGHTFMFLVSFYFIFYREVQFNKFSIDLFYVPKEILRCVKIIKGIKMGLDVGRGSGMILEFVLCVFLGTLQSCGTGFLVNLVFCVIGVQKETILKTSQITKISMVFAAFYFLELKSYGFIALIQTAYCLHIKLNSSKNCFISMVFEKLGALILQETEVQESKESKSNKSE